MKWQICTINHLIRGIYQLTLPCYLFYLLHLYLWTCVSVSTSVCPHTSIWFIRWHKVGYFLYEQISLIFWMDICWSARFWKWNEPWMKTFTFSPIFETFTFSPAVLNFIAFLNHWFPMYEVGKCGKLNYHAICCDLRPCNCHLNRLNLVLKPWSHPSFVEMNLIAGIQDIFLLRIFCSSWLFYAFEENYMPSYKSISSVLTWSCSLVTPT